jgi:DNA-binding MarR family transcriptional regulator/GNAT superfamily N-acetyltransferase
MTTTPESAQALRAFNRFWTRELGVLHKRLLESRFSLAESRLLWELAEHGEAGASTLAAALRLDLGYVSRLLAGLRQRRLLKTRRDPADGRRTLLALGASGKQALAMLDAASQAQAQSLLARLRPMQQQALIGATAQIQALLGAEAATGEPAVLTSPQPGDLGWVIARHGALYARDMGFDVRFEGLVADLVARFVASYDARHEACWIARHGEAGPPLGCVFVVQARDPSSAAPLPGVAQLRMLLVEPTARGLGLGARLVAQCSAFARAAGYRSIRLWTQSGLHAARHLYAQAGYGRISSERHSNFGRRLVAEVWELALRPDGSERLPTSIGRRRTRQPLRATA